MTSGTSTVLHSLSWEVPKTRRMPTLNCLDIYHNGWFIGDLLTGKRKTAHGGAGKEDLRPGIRGGGHLNQEYPGHDG